MVSTPKEKMDVLIAVAEAWKASPDTYFGDIIFRVSRLGPRNPFYMDNKDYIKACESYIRDREDGL